METTKHGVKQAVKRIGLNKKTVNYLLESALNFGVEHKDANGRLKKYFYYLYCHNKKANNIRIYNDYVFICIGKLLITVFKVPKEHLNSSRKILNKKMKELTNEKVND